MININNNEKEINLSIVGLNKDIVLKNLEWVEVCEGAVVCFTGNRPASLPWKHNENCDMFKEFRVNMKFLLEELVKKGVKKFISGMAMGFDIIMAEIVLELKADYAIELEGALPCIGQEDKWSSVYKARYQEILKRLDKVTLVSNSRYFDGCFHVRNHYMVDNSSLVIAGSFKSGGGTASTIQYAKKHNKPLIVFGF